MKESIPSFEIVEINNYSKENPELLDVEKKKNDFLIDINPRLVISDGNAIDGLIQSGISQNCEFQLMEKIYLLEEEKPEEIPCSKTEIFNNKTLKPKEKLHLTKFIQFCIDYVAKQKYGNVETLNEHMLIHGRMLNRPQNKVESSFPIEKYMDKSFKSFLKEECKLNDKLCDIIIFTIANYIGKNSDEMNSEVGMKNITSFIKGLGIYGNLPYLYSLYGTSDILQGFCRVSAVWGGIYMLCNNIIHFVYDNNNDEDKGNRKIVGVIDSSGHFLKSNNIIISPDFIPSLEYVKCDNKNDWVYGAFIVDKPILNDRSLTIIPPNHKLFNNINTMRIVQINSTTKCCSNGTFIVYIYTVKGEEELKVCVDKIKKIVNYLCEITICKEEEKEEDNSEKEKEERIIHPHLLWSTIYVNHIIEQIKDLPKNLYMIKATNEEYSNIDLDWCFEIARRMNEEIFKDVPFMVKIPRPEIPDVDLDYIPSGILLDKEKPIEATSDIPDLPTDIKKEDENDKIE